MGARAVVVGFILTWQLAAFAAAAADRGTPAPASAQRAVPDPKTPAKTLFGHKTSPAVLEPRAIGFYSRGCLAGAVALPVTGETWQVMRLSRKRNWGHPELVRMLQSFSVRVREVGWPGILVGDMAQARGGPMLTGHASHQVGLDADVWLTPMPKRVLSAREREQISAVNMVRRDRRDVDPKAWTSSHTAVIRAAASDPRVARVFVNPAIKRALCREAGADRGWLERVRPWPGHDHHMHIRIGCPAGSTDCEPQDPPPPGDGCGTDLDYWFREDVMNPKPPKEPPKPKPALTLADLPVACRDVVLAP